MIDNKGSYISKKTHLENLKLLENTGVIIPQNVVKKIIKNFEKELIINLKPLDPQINKMVDNNFWNLI